jgi:ATP-dependent DNA helicase RecQ
MTRAKRDLAIHLNSGFLDGLSAENLERIEDNATYLPPNEFAMHLTHRDIVLDPFLHNQPLVSRLKSGDVLSVHGDKYLGHSGQTLLKVSKKFATQIEGMKEKSYELKSAKVGFIVYWRKEGEEQEIKIVLPELYFERKYYISNIG